MFEIAKQSNNLFHKTMNININHCIMSYLLILAQRVKNRNTIYTRRGYWNTKKLVVQCLNFKVYSTIYNIFYRFL